MSNNITVNPTSGYPLLYVDLSATVNDLIDITEYKWDFGDGSDIIISGDNVNHYYDYGIHIPSVSATGNDPSQVDYTYFETDFSDGFDEAFNSDFSSTHNITQYPPDSGNYVAVRGSTDWRWVFPTSAGICGDFDFQWYVTFGENNNDNISVHLALYNDAGTSALCDLYWNSNNITWEYPINTNRGTVSASYSQYATIKLRLERVGSDITAYYYNEGLSGWVSIGTSLNYSACVLIREDGATRHGISNFNLSADSGLPYSEYSINTIVVEGPEINVISDCNREDFNIIDALIFDRNSLSAYM